LKRLDRKVRDKQAEMEAPVLLEDRREAPAPFLDLPAEAIPEPVPAPPRPETAPAAVMPRRRVFASDEALAAWALDNPDALSANQISVLRDCLSRPEAREHFRLSGIDVEALRTLLRAVA
jgi:putative transposase